VLLGFGSALLALALGLLAAYVVSLVRGKPVSVPTAGSSPSAGSPSPPAVPAGAPPAAAVPAGWTRAHVSSLGLDVRHPPTWSRHLLGKVTLWERTTPAGGRGVQEVGIGRLAPAAATTALEQFARSFFAGQPGLQVPAATGGDQRGDLTIAYRRSGVPVNVALHGAQAPQGVLLTLARAPATTPTAAAALLAQFLAGVSATR